MLNSTAIALAGNARAAIRAVVDTTEEIFKKLRITGFPCEQRMSAEVAHRYDLGSAFMFRRSAFCERDVKSRVIPHANVLYSVPA